jgi:hypothetical protein
VKRVFLREVWVEGRSVGKISRALPLSEANSVWLQTGLQIRSPKLIVLIAGLSFSLFANTGTAQNIEPSTGSRRAYSAKARLVASQPPVLPPTLTPPPSAVLIPPSRPTAEQLPLSAPQVSYADGQLTITAENSTLTDILTAIRAQMGADIDAPPSTSREHMVVRLGPGPAREVIASLLSWTNYDYVIQAADDDPAGVKSVLVTSRPKTGAGSASTGVQMARRSPFSRGGETTPTPTEAPADDPVPLAPDTPTETVADQQAAQPATQPEAAEQQTAAVGAQPETSGTTKRKSDLANSQPGLDQATLDAQAAAVALASQDSADSSSSQPPQSKSQEMVQQLQRMYQQRIQMQKMPPPSN